MDDKVKCAFILLIFPFIFSCASRKCCPDLFSWSEGKRSTYQFEFDNALSINHKLYAFGGSHIGAFSVFDTNKKTWSKLPDMPSPVFASGITVLNSNIYVLGGLDSQSQYSDAFQKFDLLQLKWEILPALSMPVRSAAVVGYNNKLYLIGGVTNYIHPASQYSSQVEEYDPVKQNWQKKSSLPTARYGHAALIINNQILVAGGITDDGGTPVVELYDPVTDKWTQLADLPEPNSFFGLIEIDKKIYAIGGYGYTKSSPIIRYDINADQWVNVGTMPETISDFGIAVDGMKVYIVGGKEMEKYFLVGKKLK